MRNHYPQQQHSIEQIQEELTLQDISLRQQIQTNCSRVNIPQADQTPHKEPAMDKNPTKNQPNCSTPSQDQLFLKRFEYYSRSCASTFTMHKQPSKINSLAYQHRNRSSENNRSEGRKTRINVSQSLKNKSGKSPKKQNDSTHDGSSLGSKQAIQVNEFTAGLEGVTAEKQNECQPLSRMVKIQQPKFHKSHPLQSQWKYNGGCLSRMIAQRAMQPKNITSL